MTAPNSDSDSFKAFEHAGWQTAAVQYADAFTSLTVQTAESLLDAAGVGRGSRVLDVASGPGHIAAAAANRGAIVTGLDFSSAMVISARARYPTVDFQDGDAEALPFPDHSFDAVVMNYGMLHLARPHQAMQEAYRVLKPGGGFAFTVWAMPPDTVGFDIVLQAIQQHGRSDVALPPALPFFHFSDPAVSKAALGEAGFVEPQVQLVPQTWRLASPDNLFEAFYEGSVRTAALLRAQTDEAREAIRAAIGEAASKYQTANGIAVAMPAVLSSARKPR